jgi:hypothetical protein
MLGPSTVAECHRGNVVWIYDIVEEECLPLSPVLAGLSSDMLDPMQGMRRPIEP